MASNAGFFGGQSQPNNNNNMIGLDQMNTLRQNHISGMPQVSQAPHVSQVQNLPNMPAVPIEGFNPQHQRDRR